MPKKSLVAELTDVPTKTRWPVVWVTGADGEPQAVYDVPALDRAAGVLSHALSILKENATAHADLVSKLETVIAAVRAVPLHEVRTNKPPEAYFLYPIPIGVADRDIGRVEACPACRCRYSYPDDTPEMRLPVFGLCGTPGCSARIPFNDEAKAFDASVLL